MFRYTKPLYTHRRIQRQQKGVYFQQAEPHLGNQYTQDLVLTDLLKRKLPEGVLGEVERDFERFGGRVSVGMFCDVILVDFGLSEVWVLFRLGSHFN